MEVPTCYTNDEDVVMITVYNIIKGIYTTSPNYQLVVIDLRGRLCHLKSMPRLILFFML